MINFFAPGAENGEARVSMNQEFLKILNQEDPYTFKYMTDLPDSLYYEDTAEKEKELTMQNVVDWVDKWDRHNGRLRFFADLTPTPYYQFVAKPLLSLKATGSISVERAAKPLKNRVASKDRNRLATSKRELLLRVGMNLRLTMASLYPNDGLVYE